ncbi:MULTISPECIES: DUF2075 domain-containing protein, partial [unclassified Acidiplasma]|uniref:DUF2075 domain-containing protein n=1 Tax=unclassified Acidiplasma TaxID=2641301 RepID=UPI00064E4A97
MRLYENSAQQLINDINCNKLSDKLENAFISYYGHRPSQAEINAWNNSFQFVKNELQVNNLFNIWVIIEYELPYSAKRIDAILLGKNNDNIKNIVILELKQWSSVELSPIDGNVKTYVGYALRCEPHPSIQVSGYYYYLKDFMDIFSKNCYGIYACAYCHNYSPKINDPMFSDPFHDVISKFPLFTKNDFKNFGMYLKEKLNNGGGLDVYNDFIHSSIKPSKKLIDFTSNILRNQKIFSLIDDQILANNTIIDRAKKASKLKNKSVIIVSGGPGTGKSVIALNAMAELLSMGLKVYHATGSKSFTSSLQKILSSDRVKSPQNQSAKNLFLYFNSFSNTKSNEIDVLIADEAHRLRKSSNNRFTKKERRSNIPQIDELINVAKVSVFFIDENQVVRPEEIGSIKLIEETAKKYNADVYKFTLKTQFRCSGSDGYLNWVDSMLNINDTGNEFLTKNDKMKFIIMDSPEELRDEIRNLNKKNPNSARMVAGFCWPWSDPTEDGTLKEDIVIGNFRATWELKDFNHVKFNKKPETPPWNLWPIDPKCAEQVGSIYTVQGFEFDYIGLIWGNDLVYDYNIHDWVGKPENSKDPVIKRDKNFTIHIKNIYRTLLTRARYGVYVYFVDKDTEKFVKSRIEMYKIKN